MMLSLIDRTDANWDLQNYHLYDPWALLHARLGLDYYAAGYQSYFNPLADLPYFILKCVIAPAWPRLVALLAGIPYGIMIFLVLGLSSRFVRGRKMIFIAALLGLTGTTTLSEIGTSYDDILVTDFLLAAMVCLLQEGTYPALAAGLLAGIGIALKLTAGVFALPLALYLMALPPPPAVRVSRLVAFTLAGAGGFLIAYGWWGWRLWQHFGDPFYPMFGSLFPSPWAMPITGQDTRFFPKTTLQWLAYPFFWLQGKPFIVAELKMRDPRFALAYLAIAGVLGTAARRRLPSRETLALWLFIVSGYLIWLWGFSIIRYALPIEVLSGVFIATVLQSSWPERRMEVPLALLTVFCLAFSKPMGWGRIGYGKTLISAPVPSMPEGTLLLVKGVPLGFVLPYLSPAPSHIVALDFLHPGSPEWAALQAMLQQQRPVWLLTNAHLSPSGTITDLAPFGLRPALRACQPVHTAVQKAIELCPLIQPTAAKPS